MPLCTAITMMAQVPLHEKKSRVQLRDWFIVLAPLRTSLRLVRQHRFQNEARQQVVQTNLDSFFANCRSLRNDNEIFRHNIKILLS